mgnify:FL=1
MSDVYHTSDLHLFHDNSKVYEPRGYTSAQEMSEGVMDVLFSTLKSGDRLINYGDNAIEGTWKQGLSQMKALRAMGVTLELRIGNHERIFPGKRDSHVYFREYAEVFDNIQLFQRARLDGVQYIQSHMPYWPNDRHEARLRQYRPVDDGLPIVHGHTHSPNVHDWERHMSVCWDAWGRPVTHGEILDWLRSQV